MKRLMDKALQVLKVQKKDQAVDAQARATEEGKPAEARQPEDWGMSPEDALRIGTVARYK
ncbi:hypothetical protein C7H09_10925 [Marinobacter fuscus]|uniref:Uncharacterized protein n=2 Tax=Marinobacter fuscus TaxID=2109942 RepID=A0A2T1K8W3_9GAMM|nr:hypothetical protein C7H09_10925 [Marinobacter fuscus]